MALQFKYIAVVTALAAAILTPASAWAFGGGAGGCSNLPEYYRALGALQGMTSSCDMTTEQARRIVAAQDGAAPVEQQAPPAPTARHRRHWVRTRQP